MVFFIIIASTFGDAQIIVMYSWLVVMSYLVIVHALIKNYLPKVTIYYKHIILLLYIVYILSFRKRYLKFLHRLCSNKDSGAQKTQAP
jgi:hypothetical protein